MWVVCGCHWLSLGFFGFGVRVFKSKHETAREVSTFKAARVRRAGLS